MKQLFLITTLHLAFLSSFAQPPRPDRPEPRNDHENRAAEMKKIQAMEMAFITKELSLNPEEAQKFWPVFNQYRSEIKAIALDRMDRKSGDQLEKQQKMLDLRKKFREDFTKVLNQERANRVFGAEEEFRSMVRKEFQKKQMEKRQLEQRKKGF